MNLFPTATKVSTSTSWQELVPFLRTGDVITVCHSRGIPAFNARVWVGDMPQCIMAGLYCLQYPDGGFPYHVTDVVLQRVIGRADELEPLVASLKSGDVVRATLVAAQGLHGKSRAITLEGTVEADRNGDMFLAVEDVDGTPGCYYITFLGRHSRRLRALEVIDH